MYFVDQPLLAFCLEYFLPHTSYTVPEGDRFPYGLGWHQLDVYEKVEDGGLPRTESSCPGSFDLTDVTVLKEANLSFLYLCSLKLKNVALLVLCLPSYSVVRVDTLTTEIMFTPFLN